MCKLDFDEAKLPPVGADEKLRGRSAIQDYLGRLSSAEEARKANKPLMVYFYVPMPKTVGGKKVKPTRQATACRTVQRMFDGGDLGIGTAAKFFVLCDVDVSKVNPRENAVFNLLTAPAVALLDSKGKLVSLLSGKISGSSLLRAMMQTLARSGINAAKIAVGKKILGRIRTLENARVAAERRRTSAEKALAAAKKKRQVARVASQEGILKSAGRKLELAAKTLAEHEKLWEDLFKKS